MTIGCPHCEEQFDIDIAETEEVGDIIECPHCGGEMEITTIAADGSIIVEALDYEDVEDIEEEDEEVEEE